MKLHAHTRTPFTTIAPVRPARCHHVSSCAHMPTTASSRSRSSTRSGSSSSRRSFLSSVASGALIGAVLSAAPRAAFANPLEDVARQLTRPDITPLDAAVALLDARSTLREMQPLVASAPDSAERFNGRKLWPSYAKWLRPVGPSAPVAAAIIAGTDAEATLSSEYGGSGGSSSPVDAVYVALGRVLTISGRTIKDEAQVSVDLIRDAELAIDGVLQQLPQELVAAAQQFRVERAAGKR